MADHRRHRYMECPCACRDLERGKVARWCHLCVPDRWHCDACSPALDTGCTVTFVPEDDAWRVTADDSTQEHECWNPREIMNAIGTILEARHAPASPADLIAAAGVPDVEPPAKPKRRAKAKAPDPVPEPVPEPEPEPKAPRTRRAKPAAAPPGDDHAHAWCRCPNGCAVDAKRPAVGRWCVVCEPDRWICAACDARATAMGCQIEHQEGTTVWIVTHPQIQGRLWMATEPGDVLGAIEAVSARRASEGASVGAP